MRYTTNYHFDLYEEDDNANLMDGYNHTVQMIDATCQQFSALIQTMSNTIKAYDTRITALETSCAAIEKTRIRARGPPHELGGAMATRPTTPRYGIAKYGPRNTERDHSVDRAHVYGGNKWNSCLEIGEK